MERKMTVARSQLVDASVTPWYHVISKTVRGARLLSHGDIDRKQWIEDRLRLLAEVFAVDVAGYAILDNHLHLLVNLRTAEIVDWSDEDVLARWFRIHPPRANRKPIEITDDLIRQFASDSRLVKEVRKRLGDLGWFMKSLKEPIARLANQADNTTGAFWQSRYKSIAILDPEALLAVSAYIDLNVFAAGMSPTPEDSPHTSLKTRVQHCQEQNRISDLKAAKVSTVAGVAAARGLEDDLWLSPIEDRRHRDSDSRPGLLDGFSLGSYLQLIDWTSRLVRQGKARVTEDVRSLLDRLDTTAETWSVTLQSLFATSRPTGVAFAFHRQRLREAATQLGRHHLANLNGCRT